MVETSESVPGAFDLFTNRFRPSVGPLLAPVFPTEAIRFAAEALAPRVSARRWRYRLVGENLNSAVPLYLCPRLRPFPLPNQDHPPSDDCFDETMTAMDDIWRDSFNAVAEIYGAGWSLGRDDIPFAEDERINLAPMN